MSKRIGIITLGCKVNQYESEAIAEALRGRGFTVCDGGEICDCYIVNTCTVTAEADRKSRQMIRRATRLNPQAVTVVTGCTAEYDAAELSRIEGVIAVCGNAEKLECADIIEKYFSKPEEKYPIVNIPPLEGAKFEKMSLNAFPRTRVYIKIEDGCENKCSYCAIPKARGNVRSKMPGDVQNEVGSFIKAGCKEIVLTGIETASYGKDIGLDLGILLKFIDAFVEDKCIIRLGSLDPSLFKERFVDTIKNLKSLAPHFHISLQSGSSAVLALMRRKYNAEGAREAIRRLREAIPNVMFTTDIIVGFPGETEENFLETVEFVKEARFLTAHIFPYSKREGTPAAEMPNSVPIEVRRERAAKLTRVQNAVRDSLLDEVLAGENTVQVLFETFSNGKAYGHTDNFLEVCVESAADLHGQIHSVKLLTHKDGVCFGEFVEVPKASIKPLRESGKVAGFRKCDEAYLQRINKHLELGADMGELHVLQSAFDSIGRDPLVQEIYFALAAHRKAKEPAKEGIFLESVEGLSDDAAELLTSLIRAYNGLSADSTQPPRLTSLAQFAATGKIICEDCGIDICLKDKMTAPKIYGGEFETIDAGSFAVTLYGGKPISGQRAGDACVLVAPPADADIDKFISDSYSVCRKYLKEFPETKIVPATDRGLAFDILDTFIGTLFDTSLLPEKSPFAESVFEAKNPSYLVFTNRSRLTRLWEIAAEHGIIPCAPAASRFKYISVKSETGAVEFETKFIDRFKFSLPARLVADEGAVLARGEESRTELSRFPYDLTVRNVGGEALYEDLADAMSESDAIYAVAGTLSPDDPALIPAILTLDSFRRNEAPNILTSRFFIGEKTVFTVIKLSAKK